MVKKFLIIEQSGAQSYKTFKHLFRRLFRSLKVFIRLSPVPVTFQLVRRRNRHKAVRTLGILNRSGKQKSGQKPAKRETLLFEQVEGAVDGLDAHEVAVLDPPERADGEREG